MSSRESHAEHERRHAKGQRNHLLHEMLRWVGDDRAKGFTQHDLKYTCSQEYGGAQTSYVGALTTMRAAKVVEWQEDDKGEAVRIKVPGHGCCNVYYLSEHTFKHRRTLLIRTRLAIGLEKRKRYRRGPLVRVQPPPAVIAKALADWGNILSTPSDETATVRSWLRFLGRREEK